MEVDDLDISLDSDDEEITADQILKSMDEIWLNEKFSPEILPQKQEIVECLYLQINEMEKNVKLLKKNDVRRCTHELELMRIRYLLASYLRTRLIKIEKFAQHILEQEETRRIAGEELYLSEGETIFAKTYKRQLDLHIENALSSTPGYINDESKDNPVKPNLHSFVFFQSKKDIDGVIVDDGVHNDDVVDIKKGSKLIMSYSSIINLLKEGDVQLI